MIFYSAAAWHLMGLMCVCLAAGVASARPETSETRLNESSFRRTTPQGAVTLRVRPSRPWVQRHLTVLLDFGNEPLLDKRSELSLVVFRPSGDEPVANIVLQPLNRKGLFGAHYLPDSSGAYRVEVRERIEPSLRAKTWFDFPLNIEASPPQEDGESTKMATKSPGGRPSGDKLPLDLTMESLGDRWDALSGVLKDPKARKDDALRLIQALSDLAANVEGQLAKQQGPGRREFDGYARLLSQRVSRLPAVIPDRPAARAEMTDIENTVCLRCHTKFRFNIADDVKDWPKFEPREPRDSKTGQEMR